jgi:hypothetical protein
MTAEPINEASIFSVGINLVNLRVKTGTVSHIFIEAVADLMMITTHHCRR